MDSSTWLDTSLDLNLNPFDHASAKVPPKKQVFDKNYFTGFGEKASFNKHETAVLVEELNRVSGENKKLTEMLAALCENYNSLQKQYMDLMNKNAENQLVLISKKRKAESEEHSHMIGFNGHTECSSSDEDQSYKKPKENLKAKTSRVYVRTSASNSTLIVKDGYQWRKYGQKVTRDNPSPRAYFKCSFAPSCPVKKKVQKSAENPSILVATYEGEHNHPPPSKSELSLSPSHGATLASIPASLQSTAPIVTLDMIQPAAGAGILLDEAKKTVQAEAPGIQQILVQQMASSLTSDPNFTAALAAAISGRFVDQARTEKWSN